MDKDNYLLQVSRYIHLNAVSAKVAERPQEYRWSSYGPYLKGKGIIGLKTATVLGQLNGSKSRQLQQYREYVEGGREERLSNPPPEVRQQIYVGDEEFVEAIENRGKASVRAERRQSALFPDYAWTDFVQLVNNVPFAFSRYSYPNSFSL